MTDNTHMLTASKPFFLAYLEHTMHLKGYIGIWKPV